MTTTEIVNANNKAIEQKLLLEIKDLPIINKHFSTIKDDAYNEPLIDLSKSQKSNLKNLLNEV